MPIQEKTFSHKLKFVAHRRFFKSKTASTLSFFGLTSSWGAILTNVRDLYITKEITAREIILKPHDKQTFGGHIMKLKISVLGSWCCATAEGNSELIAPQSLVIRISQR